MKTLSNILIHTKTLKILGDTNIEVRGISIDNRTIKPKDIFVAIKGTHVDGHQFIDDAISRGAIAIVCETIPESISPSCTYIIVENSAFALGDIASAYYDNPSSQLIVIGVTGTNGKTTVTTLLHQLFSQLKYCCGLISTVKNIIGTEEVIATHTTPDAVSIQHLLSKMLKAGCTHVFMEVSSHAIDQHRIQGVDFNGAVFTNISHDHLDYHKTFDEYIRVKKQLFDNLSSNTFALCNIDDKRGSVMLQNTNAFKYTYSLRQDSNFKGKILENYINGLHMIINELEVHFRLIGTFNAYNLLAVYGVAKLLNEDPIEVLTILSTLKGAIGRFETIRSSNDNILGIIDYAHTPDALLNVLNTIIQLRNNNEQLITVVGCGGDRDKDKRPVMASIAAEKSNKVIITSDNPRSENPEVILNEMEEGLNISQKRKVLRITDRKEAIKTACSLANNGDIILIAGKGHETYQEVNGVRHHFDDTEVLIDTFKLLNR